MNREEDMKDVINRINETTAPATQNTDTRSWYDEKGKFKHYILGRYILEHCHIKRIGGIIHIYSEEKRYIC